MVVGKGQTNTLYPLLNNATVLFFPAGIALTAGIVGIALIGVIIIARLMGPIVGVILVCVMIALLLVMSFIGNTAHVVAPVHWKSLRFYIRAEAPYLCRR